MTVTLPQAPRVAADRDSGTSWARVTDGLWTASADGVFLGTIEATDGRYLAVDPRGRTVGDFGDLATAQQFLEAAEDDDPLALSPRERRLATTAAIVAAAVSAGILIMLVLDVLR